ncbi:substrate of the Dot/Icm secretion system [Legionella busanensis]|uniref:Substrate of the Dot/Icm secretion system n=1 Tax=Legionella busanensis TaxID=190655 RepID=A0A378JP41_9GAMM|nr:hypothetical protein [Legionella busanensis]STX51750.1 substrate of the Dot/Icm secretion system [Legionella busanensis]
MQFKTEKTEQEISFDIYPIKDSRAAQNLIVENAQKLISKFDNRLFWLLRESNQEGVITIESRRYNGTAPNKWEPQNPKRLWLTETGWQDFDYNDPKPPKGVLAITKDNLTLEHIRALKDKLATGNPSYSLENMIYPELKWDIKKREAVQCSRDKNNGIFGKLARDCPNEEKGIIGRSDPALPVMIKQLPSEHVTSTALPVMIKQLPPEHVTSTVLPVMIKQLPPEHVTSTALPVNRGRSTQEKIEAPLQKKASSDIHYEYEVHDSNKSRNHTFAASYRGMKEQLHTLKGDHLKTQILLNFKSEINKATSTEDLKKIVDKLKYKEGDPKKGLTEEYAVIKTGQGHATKLLGPLGLQTSSDKALDAIIKDQENNIKAANTCKH